MKDNHILALIIAYYLSRFDQTAYKKLGFSSSTVAHKEIGGILGVKATSVKNMRDEFDPIHDNPRVGWYQRPLRASRARVVESFQDLTEEELRDIVLEILSNPDFNAIPDISAFIDSISKSEQKKKVNMPFIVRGPTGRRAEEFFIEYHEKNMKPKPGVLIDARDQGGGYDFEIQDKGQSFLVEVKGLVGKTGGIVFTSKEWDTAKKMGDKYFLVIVRNLSSRPTPQIIKNPTNLLKAKKSIFSTIQIRWHVYESTLAKVLTE